MIAKLKLFCFYFAALTFLGLPFANLAIADMKRGDKFPLSSNVSVELLQVEVQRITLDDTIDIAIVLKRASSEGMKMTDLLKESAEFCLRYEPKIISAAVPESERYKIRVVAPLFQTQNKQIGFAFKIRENKCSLEPPFPTELVQPSLEQARKVLE